MPQGSTPANPGLPPARPLAPYPGSAHQPWQWQDNAPQHVGCGLGRAGGQADTHAPAAPATPLAAGPLGGSGRWRRPSSPQRPAPRGRRCRAQSRQPRCPPSPGAGGRAGVQGRAGQGGYRAQGGWAWGRVATSSTGGCGAGGGGSASHEERRCAEEGTRHARRPSLGVRARKLPAGHRGAALPRSSCAPLPPPGPAGPRLTCTGALLVCASRTRRAMPASTLAPPTAVARTCSTPSPFTVPPMTCDKFTNGFRNHYGSHTQAKNSKPVPPMPLAPLPLPPPSPSPASRPPCAQACSRP